MAGIFSSRTAKGETVPAEPRKARARLLRVSCIPYATEALTCCAPTTHRSATACLHHAGTYKSCALLVWVKYTNGVGTRSPLVGNSVTKTPNSICLWSAASPWSSFQHPGASKHYWKKHLSREALSHPIPQLAPTGAQRKEQCCLSSRSVAACPGQLPLKSQGGDGDIIMYFYHHTQMTKIHTRKYFPSGGRKEKALGRRRKVPRTFKFKVN